MDYDDAQADLYLSTYDATGNLAEPDPEAWLALMEDTTAADEALQAMLDGMTVEMEGLGTEGESPNVFPDDHHEIPGMELLPNESYDYVLLTFTQASVFDRAVQALGLERLRDPRSGWGQHVGLCRVIDGMAIVSKLENADDNTK